MKLKQKRKAQPDVQIARCAVRVSYLNGRVSDLLERNEKRSQLEDRRLISDKMQLAEAEIWCHRNNITFDYQNSVENMDLDVSGSRVPWRKRPGLMALYEAAQQGEFNVLIAFKLSRLGRNFLDSADCCDSFEALGVRLVGVKESLDSDNQGGYRFIRNMLLMLAEWAAEDIGSNIHAAAVQRAKDGRLHGGSPPAWCKWNDNELVAIPEQVAAFRRLVELRVNDGLGITKIARQLNAEGFSTVKGAHWTPAIVQKYLSTTWIDTLEGIAYFGRSRDEEDRITILNVVPPVLSHEEAEALRAIQNALTHSSLKGIGNRNWRENRPVGRTSASSSYLLSGLVRCPHCGSSMFGSQKGEKDGRRRSYACPQQTARAAEHNYWSHSVQTDLLEDAVLRVVRHTLQLPPPPQRACKITTLEARPDKVKEKIIELTRRYMDGLISELAYKPLMEEYQRQYDHAMEALKDNSGISAHKQASMLAVGEPTHEQLRQIISLLVEKVEAPVYIDGQTVRKGVKAGNQGRGLTRFARVTLKFPTEEGQIFLAPIHKSTYSGKRFIHPNKINGN